MPKAMQQTLTIRLLTGNPQNGQTTSNRTRCLGTHNLLAEVLLFLAFSVKFFVAAPPEVYQPMPASINQPTNEDVPPVTIIRHSEMVPPQMPKHISVLPPGLWAIAQPAGVTIVLFIGMVEEGGVYHSRFDSKFIRFCFFVREQPCECFDADFVSEYLSQ